MKKNQTMEQEFSNLVELLQHRAKFQADKTAYIFLVDGETQEVKLTYGELDRQARAIAATLQKKFSPGERAFLLYAPGLEFISAFFGCLYAGIIAVPAYPPDPNKLDVSMAKLQGIIADCTPKVILTTKEFLDLAQLIFPQYPELEKVEWLASDEVDVGLADDWNEPVINESTLAFLQYTSGSTGDPKGVMVSHGNLMHNLECIKCATELTSDDIGVFWLPVYHDMGLINSVINPVYTGLLNILMSPIAFLEKPIRWLQAISRYKATYSGGPNFAYDLCVNRIKDKEYERFDLSAWRCAFSGAESVHKETMDRFADTFKPCGFNYKYFYPCYGLAEVTVAASGSFIANDPIVLNLNEDQLKQDKIVESSDGKPIKRAVGSGHALPSMEIIIVDPEKLIKCSPDRIGDIWIKGGSVAQGYWNNPEQTEKIFNAYLADTGQGPFLRTEDLGFLKDGELFVTGRIKDLIIIRGKNHYPQDIELTVEKSHKALRPGCCAAFSVEVENEEKLVVVQEVRPDCVAELNEKEVLESIRKFVAEKHELQTYGIVLIETRSIPKTSSGKIQRRLCREMFLEESLKMLAKSDLEPSSAYLSEEDSLQIKEALSLNLEELKTEKSESKRQARLVAYLQAKIAEVLKIPVSVIKPEQSIISLGLDSLQAIDVKTAIDEELKIDFDVTRLLAGDTSFIDCVEVIDELVLTQNDLSGPELQRESKNETIFPLSRGQEALYFIHKLAPKNSAYNIPLAFRIHSELNIQAMQRALQALIERHASLRTLFVDDEHGKLLQNVHGYKKIDFTEIDASAWDEEALKKRIKGAYEQPFDLKKGPLMRTHLFSCSRKEYVLLLTIHHTVFDGWSLWMIIDELQKLYSAQIAGAKANLPQIKASYADFVHEQSEMLAGEKGEELWTYWKNQLSGELPVLDLPTDYPRPAMQTFNGATHIFELSKELSEELKALARKEGVTLFMLFLSAYQVLLYRYTSQDDILVSSPTAGRSQKRFANVAGYFVNPVVMRADISKNPTFKDFLIKTRETVLGAIKHQDYPFINLVEKLQIKRDPSRSPIAQTGFVLQQPQEFDKLSRLFAGKQVKWADLDIKMFELAQQEGQEDLQLEILEAEKSFLCELKYNTDLFKPDTIQRMARHFKVLLESIVSNPDQKISELPILTNAEKHQILVEWNDTKADYPKDKCIHQLFEEQVLKTPDAVAVVFEDTQLTYAELNEKANQLAHYLQSLGVKPETLVGICVERSLEMIIGLLGILKAGGAYVPFDPEYPQERLAFMLQDTQAHILLTQAKLLESLPENKAKLICLDTDWKMISKESKENIKSGVKPDNLAYVIYTSGSTGTPKGVMIRHHAVINLIDWVNKVFSVGRKDKLLFVTSICFDLSVYDIFGILASGGTIRIASGNELRDPNTLFNILCNEEITFWNSAPAFFQQLEPIMTACQNVCNQTLRLVFLSGDWIPVTFPDVIKRVFIKADIIGLGGATEATVWSNYYPIKKVDISWDSIPYGKPIQNSQYYILDKKLSPVPILTHGELHIAGECLSVGYLNNPELSSDKFVSNPFRDDSNSKLYKTGDLARFFPDGNIEFLGRIDHQVKIRGFRIELGEIETVLSKHEYLKKTVVTAREDKPGEKRLTAYIVPTKVNEISISKLREFLRKKLPDYMIPSGFVILEALPLTPNGKIDRKALPAPDLDLMREHEFTEPRNENEKAIAEIWKEVLNIDKVSVHDNFFEVGGNSLLAVQLVSKLTEHFKKQKELSVRSIFESSTIAELSRKIMDSSAKKEEDMIQLKTIKTLRSKTRVPVAFSQELVFELARGNAIITPIGFILKGKLDKNAFKNSLEIIVDRHEILRTSYDEDKKFQIIHSQIELPFQEYNLTGTEATEKEVKIKQIITNALLNPFNLSKLPLVRFVLINIDVNEYIFCIFAHHSILDGVSLGIFWDEFKTIYQQFLKHGYSNLEQPDFQYGDYAYWQRERYKAGLYKKAFDYWNKQLTGANELDILPLDYKRPNDPQYVREELSAQYLFQLSDVYDEIVKISGKQNTTLSMLLLAAYYMLIHKNSGLKDILICSPSANRPSKESEKIMGCVASYLFYRINISDDPTFIELLEQTKKVVLKADEYSDYPFEDIMKEVNSKRKPESSSIWQTSFAVHTAFELAYLNQTFGDIEISHMQTGIVIPRMRDLHFFIKETGSQLNGLIVYQSDLFKSDTIQNLAGSYQLLLEKIIKDPYQKLSKLIQ
jgi:amino acid adenylation domain-containing protein